MFSSQGKYVVDAPRSSFEDGPPSIVRKEARLLFSFASELNLGCELQLTRTGSLRNRSDPSGSGRVHGGKSSKLRIAGRSTGVYVIECVEGIHAKLRGHIFMNDDCFGQSNIDIPHPGSNETISLEVANGIESRQRPHPGRWIGPGQCRRSRKISLGMDCGIESGQLRRERRSLIRVAGSCSVGGVLWSAER
jgi:hypothetical protein